MKVFIKFFSRLLRSVSNRYINIITNIKIASLSAPIVELHGKGRFNQEVVFYGKGKVIIGRNYLFGYRFGGGYRGALCEIQPRLKNSKVVIGNNIAMNNGVFICAADSIEIGDNCLIGQDVIIMDHDAHGINPCERRTSIGKVAPVSIGNNVWIGSRAIILPGTTLGDNCVVAAGAIVKGKYPHNVIIAGNPGRIVKTIEAI